MAKSWRKFCVEVYTPAGRVVGTDAIYVGLPARDGSRGILAGHAPLVTMIGGGLLRIEQPDDKELQLFIAGGFLQVREDAVTILAEECCSVEELDRDVAWQRIEEARAMPAKTHWEIVDRQAALAAAREMFRLSHKRKGSRPAEKKEVLY